jgi:hypothetical protein
LPFRGLDVSFAIKKKAMARLMMAPTITDYNSSLGLSMTAYSAFLPFVFGIQFTDQILQNPRKIECIFDDFQSKQNRIPKVDNFFELTNYK